MIEEIKASELKPIEYIKTQVESIKTAVGDGMGINALSGGVDSSAVTLIRISPLGATSRRSS